ncbi:MAG: YitT family protein [Oscillospiraceae bacterium]|nr:YitT family protein [Oscillospiraceae bacterium]
MNKSNFLHLAFKYLIIVVGSAVYATGFSFFLYPNSIVTGGVTGIAMIINYLTSLPVGVLTIIMNVPLFIMALRKLGLRFCIGSLVGMILASVFVDIFTSLRINATSNMLLASLYGGLIEGAGLGLVYRVGASTGGSDIASKLLRAKYPYINLGTIILLVDMVVVIAFAVIFKRFDSVMYSIIAMFVSTRVVDFVLYGVSTSKLCFIITDSSDEVKKAITTTLNRGATLLHGEGAYSGASKEVILCAVKKQQVVELRRLVRSIDENAFIIYTTAQEVFGEGFQDIMDNS